MFYFAEKVFLKGFPGSHYIMNLESSVYGCQHIQPRTIVHLFWITFICSLKFLEPVILISSLSLECNLFVYCGTSIVTFSASELKVVLWYFNRIKTIFFFFFSFSRDWLIPTMSIVQLCPDLRVVRSSI